MAQQAKDLIQGVKSFVLIPEKWERTSPGLVDSKLSVILPTGGARNRGEP